MQFGHDIVFVERDNGELKVNGLSNEGTSDNRAQGIVPDVIVPSVVMFEEPAQVEMATFSTLPRPMFALACSAVLAPVPPLDTGSVPLVCFWRSIWAKSRQGRRTNQNARLTKSLPPTCLWDRG